MWGPSLRTMFIPFYFAVSLVVLGEKGGEVKRDAVFYSKKDAMTGCVERFIACSPSELLHASEHRNVETLCRLFPSVITCMDKVLSMHCQSSRHYLQVNLLYDELDKMERKYSSSKCNIVNHGISHVPSILQMWFAIVLCYLITTIVIC